MAQAPHTWVIVGDKRGDNGQIDTIVDALPWPCERKYVHMQDEFVLGKPSFKPSLHHIDPLRSDALRPPWPDLILTVGRRPAMAALWVRQQSENRTKIILVGKPSGHIHDFALIIASAENQLPPLPNFLPITLPLMRVDTQAVANEAKRWQDSLRSLPRPLIAFLIGGETNPFIMNRQVAAQLAATARKLAEQSGGTPYITTSRRTTPAVVKSLREQLPPQAVLFEWAPDADHNPYRALLGSADGFVVTGDSISMMVEVIYLRKPLAIFPLPSGWLGGADQLRRSFVRWLYNPQVSARQDRWRQALARVLYQLDYFKLIGPTRDFRAFHRMLVAQQWAVWAGDEFRSVQAELPDDLARIVDRIQSISHSK